MDKSERKEYMPIYPSMILRHLDDAWLWAIRDYSQDAPVITPLDPANLWWNSPLTMVAEVKKVRLLCDVMKRTTQFSTQPKTGHLVKTIHYEPEEFEYKYSHPVIALDGYMPSA